MLFCLSTYSVLSQDTIYYDNFWTKLSSSKSATYYKIIEANENDKNQTTEKSYYNSGQIKSEAFYITANNEKKKLNGKNSFWYETGELKNEIFYENGVKNGVLLSYWKNGKLKRKDIYKNGKLKKGECWDEIGNNVKHYDLEISPKFPGGESQLYNYVSKNLKYPIISKQYKIGGKVIVTFIIEKSGAVSNVLIAQGVNIEIDDEATRIISEMPTWEPGYQDGNPVRVKYSLPITFNP